MDNMESRCSLFRHCALLGSSNKPVVSQKENSHLPKKAQVCFVLPGMSVGFLCLLPVRLFGGAGHRGERKHFLLCSLEQVFLHWLPPNAGKVMGDSVNG
jgi:hypothetical protein